MSATTATGRPGRRWIVRLGLLGLGLALLGLGAAAANLWWGRESPPPGPPHVSLAGVDPAVAAAVTAVRDRVVREPKSANAWGALGAILLANEFPADADPCLARAEELDPREPRWPYLRAWGLLPRDREAAMQHLRHALERSGADDKGTAVRLRLAETLLTVGANEEAGREVEVAHEVAPGCSWCGEAHCRRLAPGAAGPYIRGSPPGRLRPPRRRGTRSMTVRIGTPLTERRQGINED